MASIKSMINDPKEIDQESVKGTRKFRASIPFLYQILSKPCQLHFKTLLPMATCRKCICISVISFHDSLPPLHGGGDVPFLTPPATASLLLRAPLGPVHMGSNDLLSAEDFVLASDSSLDVTDSLRKVILDDQSQISTN